MLATIAEQYGLGTLRQTTPMDSGTAARVWRLDTDRGAFVVRTLTGPEQGSREWAMARHLLSRGFTRFPAILATPEGEPMAEREGQWYQVQRFLPGCRPNPAQPGTAAAMARLVQELTEALSDCPPMENPDSFDLGAAWQEARPLWPLLMTPFSVEQAEAEIARCAAIPEGDRQVIHGDLGPWNMLQSGDGSLSVIDFGEARMGDPYFDYASALAGAVNHAPPERREALCREFLAVLDCDRQRLMEQLRLWVWRGLVQWGILASRGVAVAHMAAKFCNALHWAEEHLYEV